MKIGILTWYKMEQNYGAKAQAYALKSSVVVSFGALRSRW